MKVKTSRVKTFQISYTSDDVMTRLKSWIWSKVLYVNKMIYTRCRRLAGRNTRHNKKFLYAYKSVLRRRGHCWTKFLSCITKWFSHKLFVVLTREWNKLYQVKIRITSSTMESTHCLWMKYLYLHNEIN